MAHTVTYESFSKICRFCINLIGNTNQFIPLFEHQQDNHGRHFKEFKESIPEIISTCIGLNIESTDGLPTNICETCLDKLTASNSFRHLCLQSANILQEIKIQHHYEQLEYDSEDNEPLHSLKPPEMVFVETIKNECDGNYTDLCNMDDTRPTDNIISTAYCQKPETTVKPKTTRKTPTKRKSSSVPLSSSTTIPIVPAKKPVSEIIEKIPKTTNITSTTTTVAPENTTIKSTKYPTTTHCTNEQIVEQSSAINSNNDTTMNSTDDDNATDNQMQPNRQKQPKKRSKMPKQCTVCGLIVKRLRDHMKIHPEALEFRCQHCSRTYLTQVGLDRHMDTQHTDSNTTEIEEVLQYTKRGKPRMKKRTRNPDRWKRTIAKTLRNHGEAYVTNGIVRDGKQLQPPCNEMCRLKCTERITQEQRVDIFKEFWNLGNVDLQRKFIIDTIHHIQPKYRRAKEFSKRGYNVAYHLFVNKTMIKVCKTFYMNTIAISSRRIRTAVQKYIPEMDAIEVDLRGKHNNHRNQFTCDGWKAEEDDDDDDHNYNEY